jgi:anti-anti-sigma factor
MQLSVVSDDDAVVRVSCEGQISQNDFSPGSNPMEALLGPGAFGRKVLLNLEKTTYIDSSGLSWLFVCYKSFMQANGKFVLHTIPGRVYQVLQIVRLPSVIPVAPDEATARSLALGEAK